MPYQVAFYLHDPGPRPDFRLVPAFLWEDMLNFDSDGNSYNPASREWTALRVTTRWDQHNQEVHVHRMQKEPLVLGVRGNLPQVEVMATIFLAKETGATISRDLEGEESVDLEELENQVDPAVLAAAWKRANHSVWRKSTLENPYPNLSEE